MRQIVPISFVFLLACGGGETVASRSARAFQEAQQSGKPIGGDGHGHERVAPAQHATADHAQAGHAPEAHATADHSRMGHSAAQHSAAQHSAAQHTAAQHTAAQHTAQQHTGMEHAPQQHATMDHSGQPATMQHGAHAEAAPPAALAIPNTNQDMRAASPASTLKADPLDTPATIAVAEAAKAANNIPDGDVRHIVPGTDQENPPTPRPAHEKHDP